MGLRHELASGVFFTAIAKYAGMAVTLFVTAILARHFTPEEFGIVNIATVFIAFFSMLSDLGIGPSIIQKDLSEDELNGIFNLTILTGSVLSLTFFFAAGFISSFYEDNSVLKLLLKLLSISIFFNSANLVPNALIMKARRFAFVAVRSFAVQIVCGGAAVVAAYTGLGIYSLIINPIASSIILFIINYFQYPLNPFSFIGKDTFKKIGSYSFFQFLFQFLNYFSRNIDKLLMGKYLSMSELGYYDKSYRLMMMPLQNITFVITPVMHPIFTQIQRDRTQMSQSYVKLLHFVALIGFPLSAGLFFMARNLVMILFGSQWAPSIPALQILSVSIGFEMLSSTTGSIFQSCDATRKMFFSGLFNSVCSISAVFLGVFLYGTTKAVAFFLCAAYIISFIQVFVTMFISTLHSGLKLFLKSLLSPLVLTAIEAVMLFGINFFINHTIDGTNHYIELIIYAITWIAVWILYVVLMKDEEAMLLINSFLNRIRHFLHIK